MERIYSVGQVNTYIRTMFTQDFMLRRISVSGEVSNLKYHTSGHIYFSLKDESGVISCVMFAGSRRGLSFLMKDGQKVVVTGSVEVYERDGRYQLYAKKISLEGAGALYERFLALKEELEEMGMFAPEYKQPVPAYAKTLGVVTAPTGAAVQDIRNIALRRNPFLQIILYPAQVQGAGAKESIVRGIETLDRMGLDVIIVGRGGGSIEDLWAFNEEEVARAIFNCLTPVISAVGHETDVTIADYVADLRAPTPSAAAELAVADIRGLLEQLAVCERRMENALTAKLDAARKRAKNCRMRLAYLSPESRIREKRQLLADTEHRMQEQMLNIVKEYRHRFLLLAERMRGLSPLDKLSQGYSYIRDGEGRTLTSTQQVERGSVLDIRVTDGRILARVEEIRKGES